MKKANGSKRSAEGKGKRGGTAKGTRRGGPRTVDEYLARVPEPARVRLAQMRAAIRSVTPREAAEIISYGIPAFKHKVVLVWYAAFASHCSLFPTAAGIEAFKKELQGYRTSKGTIHFPTDKPLPLALIKKIVRARVAAQAEKSKIEK